MDIRISSVEYKEFSNDFNIEMDVNFTINGKFDSNITIYDEKRLDIDEIINYIRKELVING